MAVQADGRDGEEKEASGLEEGEGAAGGGGTSRGGRRAGAGRTKKSALQMHWQIRTMTWCSGPCLVYRMTSSEISSGRVRSPRLRWRCSGRLASLPPTCARLHILTSLSRSLRSISWGKCVSDVSHPDIPHRERAHVSAEGLYRADESSSSIAEGHGGSGQECKCWSRARQGCKPPARACVRVPGLQSAVNDRLAPEKPRSN
jgi:hypothetical protein